MAARQFVVTIVEPDGKKLKDTALEEVIQTGLGTAVQIDVQEV